MAKNTIADAIHTLEGLLSGLDQAYWEANSIDGKDFFYDLISSVNIELSELNKLSVQDHDLDYEPVTLEFRAARAKLTRLRKLIDDFTVRSATAVKLEGLINETLGVITRLAPVL